MDPHRSRALDLLAPTAHQLPAPTSADDDHLRDEEAQLARLELSLARAERAGDSALVGRLTALRHAQQARVLEARRTASVDRSGEALLAALDAHPAVVAYRQQQAGVP